MIISPVFIDDIFYQFQDETQSTTSSGGRDEVACLLDSERKRLIELFEYAPLIPEQSFHELYKSELDGRPFDAARYGFPTVARAIGSLPHMEIYGDGHGTGKLLYQYAKVRVFFFCINMLRYQGHAFMNTLSDNVTNETFERIWWCHNTRRLFTSTRSNVSWPHMEIYGDGTGFCYIHSLEICFVLMTS